MADEKYNNIFNNPVDKRVPVKVVVDGKELVVGEADIVQIDNGLVNANINFATDAPQDVIDLFSGGITGYSIPEGPKHRTREEDRQILAGVDIHEHKPVQHRDGKPAWCKTCKLTADYTEPESYFNFGKPALPLNNAE